MQTQRLVDLEQKGPRDNPQPGTYTLDGDRLVFNVGGEVRPTVFVTVAGQTMRSMRRVEP